MAIYKVNPDTIADTGLKFRNAPALDPDTQVGILQPGDLVESIGQPQSAPPVVWLAVRVVSSTSVAPGASGYAAMSYNSDQYLIPADTLLDATARAAVLMNLPPLLLKAFMGVEGADASNRDGVLQVTPATRPGVIGRLARGNKLAALGLADDPAVSDADLNSRFARAFDGANLLVQVLTGAQYISEQLDQFNGYVALAGLAYNGGPGTARSVINSFGGDPLQTALQYHKLIGPAPNQVTVQPGVDQVDPATGAHWTRYPVLANDSGKEIFQYLYLRQVPGRNFGLLDFIYQPRLLAARGLYENEPPPGDDTGTQALAVIGGQFKLVSAHSTAGFLTAPLSQRDTQWKDIGLGFGDASTTIGSDGCTLTCLTMLANGLGYQETPASLNDRLKRLGAGAGFSGALIVWSGVPAALPGISLQNFILCASTPAPMADIDAALDAGMPVVVEVDFAPQSGFQNHWVVIYARQGGDYLIHDPWPAPAEATASLTQRYGFAGTPAQIINAAAFYTGQAPAQAGVPYQVVVNDEPDIVAAGGLNLRVAPIDGAVILRLAVGAVLDVTEPVDGASAKVGQEGQWLSVRTTSGLSGFVAAWLVHAAAPAPKSLMAELQPRRTAPVAKPALRGVTQPALRHAPILVVAVNKPQRPVAKKTARSAKKVASKAVQKRSQAGVPLRARPARGKVIAELKPGAHLTVAEPADVASTKLGKAGQWLNVYDAHGHEGFVAAAAVHAIPSRRAATRKYAVPKRVRAAPVSAVPAVAPALMTAKELAPVVAYPVVAVKQNPDVVAAGGLNLRSAPVNGAVEMILPAGTQLQVHEAPETALLKVGQVGQWLQVSTSDGAAGYVAAWYVELVQAAPVPPQPLPPVQPPVPADVIAQGVVLAIVDAPLLNAAQAGSDATWRVTAGTPLRVAESGDWSSKLGHADQFIQVHSYAFKTGFMQASLLALPGGLDNRTAVVDARVPVGIGSWLYGLHDAYDRNLFAGTNRAGWVLFTERVGAGAGNLAYADWAKNDYGVIARLNNDYGGSGTIPTPDQYDAFAAQCAQWVRSSPGCCVWVIGNEMNNPREWPEEGRNSAKAITPESYATCYNKVRSAIKSVQPAAIVVPGALDCFQGPQMSCLDWLQRMLADVDDIDGLALHCYTHGADPRLITDLGTFGNDPLRWQYYHFRAYATFLDVIPARFRSRPVFITETDAFDQSPWAAGQNGWVQAAYAEINRWNLQPFSQQIRALLLYRWSRDDNFSISDKPGVQLDIRNTIAATDYRWRW